MSLTAVKKEDVDYLRDKTSLPYLPWINNCNFKQIAQYLLNPPSFVICRDRPANCHKNAIFLIDRVILASDDDIKSDDFSWRNVGTKPTSVTLSHRSYVLYRTYFVHTKYKDFKSRIYRLCEPGGTPCRYIMLCYLFEEDEHKVSPSKKARMQP